jgi:GntR family transcriptional regulator
MWVHLDEKDGRALYVQIMDEIRRALVRGAIRPEDPLPSVRELAAELVVKPRTVLQAYQELEREGVVYVRRGQGTFVSPRVSPDQQERRTLARGVAKRVLLEARRNGLGVDELVSIIQEVAAEEDEQSSRPAAANQGEDA